MLTKDQVGRLRQVREYGIGRLLLLARKEFVARLMQQISQGGDPIPPSAGGALLPFIDLEGTRSIEIARRMGITKQAVGKALKELEDAGLVVRSVDHLDRRAFLVSFTPEGLEYLVQIHDAINAVELHYAEIIGDEGLELLRATLATLVYPERQKLPAVHPCALSAHPKSDQDAGSSP
ncbi:MAG: MarR family transcriptional regulator [Variovorax sp.]|nr:MAG: MarR family transcriptional regulator [Variovorax sp.]